jgi:DNA polymerase-3 subunit gamma/tau
LRAAAALAASGRDPGQVLRDLEVHARELLTVQILGEVPPELRVTPDRDRRLAEQAVRLHETDAVRLLELVSAALEATANGAQPRIQLELVLIKAAAPEMDPSTSALLARIERLEGRLAEASPAKALPDQAPTAPVAPPREPDPTPEPVAPPAPPPPPMLDGPVNLEAISALWPAVVDIVRGGNAMLAAALDGARPLAVSESELTLAFSAPFMKKKAEQEDNRRVAAEAVRNITGTALQLRYELAAEPEVAEEAAAQVGEVLSEDELVRRFVEELDAQEIAEPEESSD